MQLSIEGRVYRLASVGFRRRRSGLPEVRLGFPTANIGPSDRELEACSNERASCRLVWSGGELELRAVDWRAARPEGPRVLLAQLSADLVDWLEDKPPNEGRLLVYQRSSPAVDPSAASFLKRACGGRLGAPPPQVSDVLERRLPMHSCLLRPDTLTNAQFFEQLVGFVRAWHQDVLGWTAIDHGAQQLQLLTDSWPRPLRPDVNWIRLQDRRFGTTRRYRRRFRVDSAGDTLAAIARGDIPKLIGTGESAQWPQLPGLVLLGARELAARSVGYRISMGSEPGVWVTMDLDPTPSRASAWGGVHSYASDGRFDGWSADGDMAHFLPTADDWRMISPTDGNPDPEQPLLARSMSPKIWRSDAAAAGFYVRHRQGDTASLQIDWASVPHTVGCQQVFDARYEHIDMTIASKNVLITCHVPPEGPADAPGLLIEGPDSSRLSTQSTRVLLDDAQVRINRPCHVDGGVHVDE